MTIKQLLHRYPRLASLDAHWAVEVARLAGGDYSVANVRDHGWRRRRLLQQWVSGEAPPEMLRERARELKALAD